MHVLGDLRQFPKGIEFSYFAQGTFVVFIRPGSSNLREMPDRQAATGIDGLRFHDLRREFACQLLESSADLHDVRDFLGHANITTTSRYLRSAPVRLAPALERMEASTVPLVDADEQRHLAKKLPLNLYELNSVYKGLIIQR